MQKPPVIPSFLIIFMGLIDCITTVLGVLYSGAKEMNPFMAGIVSSNIGVFMIVKIAATVLIAAAYLIANKTLMQSQDKSTKSFMYSRNLLKICYGVTITFLLVVVVNNLIILFA